MSNTKNTKQFTKQELHAMTKAQLQSQLTEWEVGFADSDNKNELVDAVWKAQLDRKLNGDEGVAGSETATGGEDNSPTAGKTGVDTSVAPAPIDPQSPDTNSLPDGKLVGDKKTQDEVAEARDVQKVDEPTAAVNNAAKGYDNHKEDQPLPANFQAIVKRLVQDELKGFNQRLSDVEANVGLMKSKYVQDVSQHGATDNLGTIDKLNKVGS